MRFEWNWRLVRIKKKSKHSKWQMQFMIYCARARCPAHWFSMHTVQWFAVVMFIICIFPPAMLIITSSALCLCLLYILSLSPSFLRRAISIQAKPGQTQLNESHAAKALYTLYKFSQFFPLSVRNRLTHCSSVSHDSQIIINFFF